MTRGGAFTTMREISTCKKIKPTKGSMTGNHLVVCTLDHLSSTLTSNQASISSIKLESKLQTSAHVNTDGQTWLTMDQHHHDKTALPVQRWQHPIIAQLDLWYHKYLTWKKIKIKWVSLLRKQMAKLRLGRPVNQHQGELLTVTHCFAANGEERKCKLKWLISHSFPPTFAAHSPLVNAFLVSGNLINCCLVVTVLWQTRLEASIVVVISIVMASRQSYQQSPATNIILSEKAEFGKYFK